MKKKENNVVMEGFNPKTYRRTSLMFIILTLLNIAVVIFAFQRTGYGLWHAEDALSRIAKVNSNFGSINESLLRIELNSSDDVLVQYNIEEIFEYNKEIAQNADEFRKIDLSNIDPTLDDEFEISMEKINKYYTTIAGNLNAVKNHTAEATVLRSVEVDTLQSEASKKINELFEKADQSTYEFFCRVGQRFLFVILFLIITMAVGLVSTARAKKRDYASALKLQNSKQKSENMRQKAIDIAYTNVVTGLKNRFAFEEMFDKDLKSEDVVIAMFNFNHFKSINEKYSRDFADEYIATIAQKIVDTFGKQAEIYHTDVDEFCILFNRELSNGKAGDIAQKILRSFSQAIQVNGVAVQLTVSGCICYCDADTYQSANALLMMLDNGINRVKTMCHEQNRSILLPVNQFGSNQL